VRWYDIVGSITYFTHFIVPVAAAVILWVVDRRQWVRYVRRFATVVLTACACFVMLPTVPPWMASSTSDQYDYRILPPLHRSTGRGWHELGLSAFTHAWETGRDWANPVAALPSLHAAYALFVVAFLLPTVRRRWVKAAMLIFPLMMAASLVYFGEHYVVDVLAGWALVGGSFLFWGWFEQRQRTRAADRAIAALPRVANTHV
jgi:membrane-associated phospholipid phosphatase